MAGNPAAIGYASLALVKDGVKAVRVNGVVPSEQTIRECIQRPFVLATKEGVELPAAAKAFFDYAVSEDAKSIITFAGVAAAD